MRSYRNAVFAVFAVLLLLQPVVGSGPGPEAEYTHNVTEINLANHESVEIMFEHPDVAYQLSDTNALVEEATNSTVRLDPNTLSRDFQLLTDYRFLADDVHDQYYRVDARVTNGSYLLDATAVSEQSVAAELAIPLAEAEKPIRDAVEGDLTSQSKAPATIVVQNHEYLLVWVTATNQVPDRLAPVKILAYAIAISLLVFVAISESSRLSS